MLRWSASTTKPMSRRVFISADGHRDRTVGPAAGRCGLTVRSESSWGTPKYPPSHIYAQALMIRPTTRTNSTRDCSLATSTTSTSPNHTNTSQTRVDPTSTPIIQILECLPSPIPDVAPHIQPATLTPLTPPSNTKRHIHALGRLVETTDGGHRLLRFGVCKIRFWRPRPSSRGPNAHQFPKCPK